MNHNYLMVASTGNEVCFKFLNQVFLFPVYFSTSHNFTFTVPATVGRLLTPHEIKAATLPNTVEQLAAKALHFWGPMVRFDDFVS